MGEGYAAVELQFAGLCWVVEGPLGLDSEVLLSVLTWLGPLVEGYQGQRVHISHTCRCRKPELSIIRSKGYLSGTVCQVCYWDLAVFDDQVLEDIIVLC